MEDAKNREELDILKDGGVSLFSRSMDLMNDDPLEEIFALNLGDFLCENLINDSLADKISHHKKDKSESLKEQLKELISIYSIDSTLSLLGFGKHEDYIIYDSIARAIKKCSEWLVYYAPVGDITSKTGDYIGIQTAGEIMLEKTYNPDLTIDYSIEDNTNNYDLIKRFQHFLHTSQIRNNLGGMSFADAATVHFSNKYKNSLELIKEARGLITPAPVNYNNAKVSGWVD